MNAMNRRLLSLVALVVSGYVAFHVSGWVAPARTAAQQRGRASTIAGTASLAGTVTAAKPFKAAQVFIRNVDKSIGYMVFTNAGQFRSTALLPGNYEVTVKTKDLVSDVQKLALKAGDSQSVNVAMRDFSGNLAAGGAVNEAAGSTSLVFQSYDEIYPANGPGKQVAERVCMTCHGENFFPSQPANEALWNARIDHMQGKALWERDATSYAQGLLAYRTSMFQFSRQDREDLVAYLVKNFGPDAKPRAVRTDKEMPIDEAKLAKAMYIEYYLPPDAQGQGTKSPEFINAGPYRGRRVGQDVRFDNDGNVWLVDRGFPHRLVKLDPRTGEQKAWVLPDPDNGIHEVMIDRGGMIWLPEHSGTTPTQEKRLLMFNPKTEKFEKMIPMDPDNVVRNSVKWLQSLAIDSKDNIYVGWIMGGALSKYDRATGKVSVFRVPTPHAIVYGVVADRNDNIWIARVERREDREVRHRHQCVDRIHAAERAGARAAPERRLPEQHLVGHLCGRQSPGQAGEARSDDRPDDGIHDTVPKLATVRRGRRHRGQHLVRGFTDAGSRRGDRQVQHQGSDVHVLSEAAVCRGHAEDPGDARRRGLVVTARHPGGRARDQRAPSGHGQDHHARRVLRQRCARISVQGGAFNGEHKDCTGRNSGGEIRGSSSSGGAICLRRRSARRSA